MQITAIREVDCPDCGTPTSISIPTGDVELRFSHSVAAFGEQTKVTCSNGHTYWVHFCR
ncbi:hypothetical protein [Natronorubrum sulfidifaciens]